jgi:hypothetical protein
MCKWNILGRGEGAGVNKSAVATRGGGDYREKKEHTNENEGKKGKSCKYVTRGKTRTRKRGNIGTNLRKHNLGTISMKCETLGSICAV